jgi:hypothetical protein
MTDKQFDEFLRQQSNKTDITDTSFWVSSRDDKGNSEWKHYDSCKIYNTLKEVL